MAMGEKEENLSHVVNIKNANSLLDLVKNIKNNGKFAYFLRLDGVSLCYGETEYFVSLSHDLFCEGFNESEFFETMKPLFEDEKILKICFDSKQDMYFLKNFKISLKNYFDISIAKYLVDGVPVDSVEDVFFEKNPNNISSRILKFFEDYLVKIKENDLEFLFYQVENRLSEILFSMEDAGFKIDENVLNDLRKKYETEMLELENKIYEIAGEKFNINSPKQLASILYDKLGLPHNKKQTTSAEHLQEIQDEHEIVKFVLRYRKVAKFLSTYIVGIFPHLDSNHFVHTYFKQTFTTTGRLSSTEPNLQNIPIRSDESKEIRSMFVASDEEHVLIDADYSQIELRLLAHMSEDKLFLESFNRNEDIHTKTASSILNVPEELVTKEMRRIAKVVNFGIIYGISEYGLADDLKITAKEAREYIRNYYQKHVAVQQFMNNAIMKARETGKATTLFGRTRKMFDINASNFMVRSRAERASQNMPLQGTAADIVKIAMVNTFDALKRGGFKAKLIMQVHDELIIDCPVEEVDAVKKLLKDEMENVCELKVPLVVDVVSSYRWSEGH